MQKFKKTLITLTITLLSLVVLLFNDKQAVEVDAAADPTAILTFWAEAINQNDGTKAKSVATKTDLETNYVSYGYVFFDIFMKADKTTRAEVMIIHRDLTNPSPFIAGSVGANEIGFTDSEQEFKNPEQPFLGKVDSWEFVSGDGELQFLRPLGITALDMNANQTYRIGTVYIKYDNSTLNLDSFSLAFAAEQYGRYDIGYDMPPSNVVFEPFNVGPQSSAPDQTLKSLSVKGAVSNTNYITGFAPATETYPITISYKDSLQPLIVTSEVNKASASAVETNPGEPYNTGEQITIAVTDSAEPSVTKTYTVSITVTAANTDSTLKTLTMVGLDSLNGETKRVSMGNTPNPIPSSPNTIDLLVPYKTQKVTISAVQNATGFAYFDGQTPAQTYSDEVLMDGGVIDGGVYKYPAKDIIVYAEDGSSTTYTINITRELPSTDATLEYIKVGGDAEENKATKQNETTYVYEIGENTSSFQFKMNPTKTTSTLQYVDSGGATQTILPNTNTKSFTIANKGGSRDVTIIVTPESGSANAVTYTLRVTRAASSVAELDSIKFSEDGDSGATGNITQTPIKHTITNNNKTTVKVLPVTKENGTYVLEDLDGIAVPNETVNIADLLDGDNLYKLIVTSANGLVTKTYNINIYKKSDSNGIESIQFARTDLQTLNSSEYSVENPYGGDATKSRYVFNYIQGGKALDGLRVDIKTSPKSTISVVTPGGLTHSASGTNLFNHIFQMPGLSQSDHVLEIDVISESGKIYKHTYYLTRLGADDTDTLEYIKIDNILINDPFNPSHYTYTDPIVIDATKTSATITAKPTSLKAKARIVTSQDNQGFGALGAQVSSVPSLQRGISYAIKIYVQAETGDIREYSFTLIAANKENNITGIKFENKNIPLAFDPDTTIINLTVPYSTNETHMTVSAESGVKLDLEDSGATTTVNQGTEVKWSLGVGANTKKIRAKSEAGIYSDKIYTVTITRQAARTDRNLDSVIITKSVGGQIVAPIFSFDPNVKTYDIRVDSTVQYVTFDVSLPSPTNGSKIESPITTSTTGTYQADLADGQITTVTFTVVAEDGVNKSNYIFNIKRANNNPNITSVNINGIGYNVNAENFPGGVLTLPEALWNASAYQVIFTLEDPGKATISQTNLTHVETNTYTWALLNVGNNQFTFQGVAQDKENKTPIYTVKVEKPTPRTDAFLENVTITGNAIKDPISFEFLPNKFVYDIRVDSKYTFVDFVLTLPSPSNGSKIEAPAAAGTYQLSLNEGAVNPVSFTVTAEDGTTKNTYTFNIKRADNVADITSVRINGVDYGLDTFDPITKVLVLPDALYNHNEYEVVFNLLNSKARVDAPLLSGIASNYKWSIISPGAHQFTFQGVAQDGVTKTDTYTVKVTKLAARNSTDLTSLEVFATVNIEEKMVLTSPYSEFTFDKGRRQYIIYLPKTVTEIRIEAAADTANGARLLNPSEQTGIIQLGTANYNQNFDITVQAENGDVKNYTVRIVRLSNKNNITGITVYNTELGSGTSYPLKHASGTGFDQGIYEYTLDELEFNVKNITFNITPEDEFGLLGVNGSYPNSLQYSYLVQKNNSLKFRIKSETGVEGPEYTITFTRKEASGDSLLASLAIYKNAIETEENNILIEGGVNKFAPNTYNYTLGVDEEVDNVLFRPVTNCPYAKVSLEGVRAINSGMNQFVLKVTAENGTYSEYTIKITKADTRNGIISISIDGEELAEFNPSIKEYTLTKVPFSKPNVSIDFTTDSPVATKHGYGDKQLTAGIVNEFKIWAISEANVKGEVYTIKIERETASTNTLLQSLEVLHAGESLPLTPTFVNTQLVYTVRVNRGQNNLIINAVPEDSTSVVSGTGAISVGDGGTLTQTITVTSQGGSHQNYTVNIICKNDNSNITEIILGGQTYTLASFSSPEKTLVLDAVAFNIKNMTVKVNMEDTNAKYDSNYAPGNVKNTYNAGQEYIWNLTQGENTLTLQAVSEFGTKSEDIYTVKVTQNAADTNNYLQDLIVSTNNLLESNLIVSFDKLNEVYNIEIPRTQNNIYIKATPESNKATIKIAGATYNPINTATQSIVANTTIIVSVESELGGDARNYQIVVKKVSDETGLLSVQVGSHLINVSDFIGNAYEIATPFAYNLVTTPVFVKLADKDYAKYRTNIEGYNLGENPSDQTITYNLIDGVQSFTITPVSEKGTVGETYTITLTKAEPNTEKTLLELVVNKTNNKDTNLITFNPETELYNIRVDKGTNELFVFARPTSTTSKVFVNNNLHTTYNTGRKITLLTDDQTITVRVTNEINEETTYTIKVTRKNDNSTLTHFDFMSIENLIQIQTSEFLLEEGILTYRKTVLFSDNSIAITPWLQDSLGKYKVEGIVAHMGKTYNSGEALVVNPALGETIFSITPISEYGTEGVKYRFIITKNAGDTNNYLEYLNIRLQDNKNLDNILALTPTFDPSTTEYQLRVDNDITTIFVDTKAQSSTSGITIADSTYTINNNYSFNVASIAKEKTLTITVTPEAGSSRTYKVKVITKNANANIDNIVINGFVLKDALEPTITGYKPETLNYIIDNVGDPYVTITVTPNDEFSNVQLFINGVKRDSAANQINVINGTNTISVYITAQDGVTKSSTYTIKFDKAQTDYKLKSFQIFDITGGIETLLFEELSVTAYGYEYVIANTVNQVKIVAVPVIADHAVSNNNQGISTLNKETTFEVTVGPMGTGQKYSFKLTKKDSDTSIKNASLLDNDSNNWLSTFDSAQKEYNIEIPYKETSLHLNIIPNSANAIVIGNKNYPISELGVTPITFYVKAEDGTIGDTYTVNVTRKAAQTSNELDGMEVLVDGVNMLVGELAFNPSKKAYTITVPLTADKALIQVTEKEGQTIGGPVNVETPLGTGPNNFNITVTPEKGTATAYTITIIKEAPKSNDNSIKNANLLDSKLNNWLSTFDAAQTEYNIEIPYKETALNLNIIPNNTNAKVTGNGNYPINAVGVTPITFSVKAEDGTVGETYTVNVTKLAARNSTDLTSLEVFATVNIEEKMVLTSPYSEFTFDKGRRQYIIYLPKTVTEIRIEAAADTANGARLLNPSEQTGIIQLGTTNYNQNFDITVQAENGDVKNYTVRIVRLSNKNNITGITVYNTELGSGTSYPLKHASGTGFDQGIYEYTLDELEFNVKNITFNITPEDEFGLLGVNGSYPNSLQYSYLVQKNNSLKFRIKSETGVEGPEYTITFTRKEASGDSLLASLAIYKNAIETEENNILIEGGVNKFAPNTYNYTLGVDEEVDNVLFRPVTNCPYAKVSLEGVRAINSGMNQFVLKVTAENGTYSEYTIKITKADTRNGIISISIDGEELAEFNPSIKEYTLTKVPFSKSNVSIDFTTDSPVATKHGYGDKQLTAGIVNEFKIWAISEANVKGEVYTIKIERETASTNTLLQSLEVLHAGESLPLTPTFVNTQLVYTVRVNRGQNNLIINAVPEDSTSVVSGTGAISVGDGGTLTQTITVTSQGGSHQNYTVNIICKNDNSNITEIILGGQTYTLASFSSPEKTLVLDAVAFNIKNMTVKVNMEDTNAKYDSNYAPGNVKNTYNAGQEYIWNLTQGENTLTLQAVSEFGTKSEDIYTVKVTQNAADTNNYLQDLIVSTNNLLESNLIVSFDKLNEVYNIEIPRTQNNIYIKATPESNKATIKIAGATYNPINTATQSIVANTTIIVSVESELGGDARNYQIVVKKVSDETGLLSVQVGSHLINVSDFIGNAYEIATPFAYNLVTTPVFVKLADKDYAKYRTNIEGYNLGENPSDQTITYNLIDGVQSFTITPVSEKGTVGETYTITLTKAEPNTEKTLLELVVNKTNNKDTNLITFNPETELYNIRVDKGTNELFVFARPKSTTSKVFVNNNSHTTYNTGRKITLLTDDQTITVRVTNEINEETTYTIKVTRKNDNSTLTHFDFMSIENLIQIQTSEFLLEEGILTYRKTVLFSDNSIAITPWLQDSLGKYKVEGIVAHMGKTYNSGEALVVNPALGETIFSITPISEYGTEGVKYRFIITKNAGDTNNYLEYLNIRLQDNKNLDNILALTPTFDPSITEYQLRVDNDITTIFVDTKAQSSTSGITIADSTYTINNNYSFNVASIAKEKTLTITVTPEAGSSRTYKVKVITKNANANIDNIVINGFVLKDALEPTITGYKPETLNYIIDNVGDPYVTITVTPNDEFSNVQLFINGVKRDSAANQINVINGTNTISVYITAQDGVTKSSTYTIKFDKAQTDYKLKSFQIFDITGGIETLLFEELSVTAYGYEYVIANTVNQVKIVAVPVIADHAVSNNNQGISTLNKETTFEVTVGPMGTGQKYSFKLTKKDSDTSIKNASLLDNDSNNWLSTFDSAQKEYNIEIPYKETSLHLNIIPNSANAIVIGNKNYPISELGVTPITFYVKAEDGTIGDTYTVNVTRKAAQTSNELDGMEVLVDGVNMLVGELAFNPSKKAYTITVPLTADKALIQVTEKEGQTIGGPVNVETPLGTGPNNFNITVTPEKGTATAYTITIIKEAPKSNDNSIKNANLLDSKLNNWLSTFDAAQTEYNIEIPYKETALNLNIIPNNTNAKVTGNGNYPINAVGVTPITFSVKAEDGTVGETYTVNVTRKSAQTSTEPLNIEALVDGVNVLVGDLAFNPTKTTYIVPVPVTSISALIHVTEKEGQTIGGLVDVDTPLAIGNNSFNITVTPEFGSAKIYLIQIVKEEPKSNDTNILGALLRGNDNKNYLTGENAFNPAKKVYDVTVPFIVDQLDLIVTPVSNKSKVDANGLLYLNTYGEGNITPIYFQVEAEDGTLGEIYTINVTRRAPEESNEPSNIEVLVDGINRLESFDPAVKTYNISVPLTSNNAIVKATLKSGQTATGDVNTTRPLQEGLNIFNVVITPEEGSGTTYVIRINKEAAKSSDNKIGSVTLKDIEGNEYLSHFNEATDTYEIIVPYKVGNLNLKVTPNDTKATVIGNGPYPLNKLGDELNPINFHVVAEDGTAGIPYTVNVRRTTPQQSNEVLELMALVDGVNKLEGIFNPNTSTYVIKVNLDANNAEIKVTPKEGQTITGDNDILSPLHRGANNFRVTVTPETGSAKIYTVNILKQNDDSSILDVEVIGVLNDKNYPIDYPTENVVTVDFAEQEVKVNLVLPDGATLVNPKTTYPTNGPIKLIVRAENGQTTEHVINVNKHTPNDENQLEELKVIRPNADNFTYKLNLERTRHHIYILSDEETIDIKAVLPTGATATGLGIKQVLEKKNNLVVVVKAENLSEKVYEIIIHKIDNDATLAEINVNNKELDDYKLNTIFNPETFEYEVYVPNTTNTDEVLVSIDAVPLLKTSNVSDLAPFVLKDNETITKKIKVTAQSGKVEEYTLHFKTIKPGKLIELAVEDYQITPEFNENITEYTLSVPSDVTNINIIATASLGSSVFGDGTKQLKPGLNTFQVYAIDEHGEIGEVYTINVTREIKSRNNALADIRVYDFNGYVAGDDNSSLLLPYEPTFSEEILNYILILPSDKSDINQVVVEADKACPKQLIDNLGSRVLESDVTVLPIRVVSETGEPRTYQIIVYRQEPVPPLLDNTELTSLTAIGNDNLVYLGENPVTGGKVFDKDTYDYYIELPANVKDITFTAEGVGYIYYSDKDAPGIYSNGRFNFENRGVAEPDTIRVLITIVPENGNDANIKHYNITFERESASDNANLKELKVNGITPTDFDPQRNPNRTDFLVVVPYGENKRVAITAIPEDLGADVVINNGEEVILTKEGFNYFNIRVIAPNGNIKDYTIIIDNSKTAGRKDIDDVLNDLITISVLDSDIENFDVNARYYEVKVTNTDKRKILKDPKEYVKAIFAENSIYERAYEVFADEHNENFVIVRLKADNNETVDYVLFLNSSGGSKIVDNFLLVGAIVLWFILTTWFASYLIYKNRQKKESEIK